MNSMKDNAKVASSKSLPLFLSRHSFTKNYTLIALLGSCAVVLRLDSDFGLVHTELNVLILVKTLTHYKDFHKDFSKKNRWENRCPYIKLLKKSSQL